MSFALCAFVPMLLKPNQNCGFVAIRAAQRFAIVGTQNPSRNYRKCIRRLRGTCALRRIWGAFSRSKTPRSCSLLNFRKPRRHCERAFFFDLAIFSLELAVFSIELAAFSLELVVFSFELAIFSLKVNAQRAPHAYPQAHLVISNFESIKTRDDA